MKRSLLCIAAVLALLFSTLTAVYAAQPVKDVQFGFERADQIWHAGETTPVTITVLGEENQPVDSGTLTVELTNDGRGLLSREEFDLTQGNPVTVSASLSFPGHLLIRAIVPDNETDTKTYYAGLGFDPDKIEPGLPKPKDFDRFWKKGKAEIRKIPLGLEMERLDSFCSEKREVWQVRFNTIGDSFVYGYLSKPVGEGPFPGIVNVPGAGPGDTPDTGMADLGFAVLKMNVFPYPVPFEAKERDKVYNDFNNMLQAPYYLYHADDRETYYFRSVYLGIDRAVDWFADQPFVDKNRIGYLGTSQGGGSALILASMNENIKAAVASVPAICDHAGILTGRNSGWPQMAQSPDDEAVLEASRYLDAVNFARSVKIPIRVTVGFIDTCCCASSVWAAYNVIPSHDKAILTETKLGHQNGGQYQKAVDWLFDTIKNM